MERSFATLLASQNADGGWPYRGGPSWTEPTVFALLALGGVSGAQTESACRRGLDWLRSGQRPDGGWAPQSVVRESTWVTTLPLLLPARQIGPESQARAVNWLLRQSGRESSFVYRLRQILLGNRQSEESSAIGWPWFPGAAAWVIPTSLSILALRKFLRVSRSPNADEQRQRVEEGRRFLIAHGCADGGWNHGSSRALGYASDSYPETTGLALLALVGYSWPERPRSIAKAEELLQGCRSVEGVGWLQLGLMAHGKWSGGSPWSLASAPPVRNLRDLALSLLAEQAFHGRNAFLD